jgi:class I lanthipeptide synthase
MRMHAEPASGAPVDREATGAPRCSPPRSPLLSGALREEALHLAGALARTLPAAAATSHRNPSLASGSAGLAVCVSQLARTRAGQPGTGGPGPGQPSAETALTYLEDAVGVLATEPLTSSLYSGFTGIAWAVELVEQLLGPEGEDRNGDIDEALAGLLPRYPRDAPYDLINGLTGLGVYALARWPRPGAAPCLLGVVEQLARRACEDRDGVYWWTPSSWRGLRGERYRPPGVDLGVAHGIAGVIPFLARVHRLGLARPVVRPLLDGAVRWLLAHLVDTESGPTVPYFVAEGVEPGPARSAWCYGDPGVALALLLAARDVGELDWATAATGLALRAAARPAGQTGVTDAGLCHGSAGLAHLFNRLYQLTAEQALADAARFWVERTLELCAPSVPGESAPKTAPHGAASPRTAAPGAAAPGRVPLTAPAASPAASASASAPASPAASASAPASPAAAWPACAGPGLLEGTAGVALALEAAGTATEPAWDQMLLVSSLETPGA